VRGRREQRKEKSFQGLAVATVEGTPTFGMPVAFAGCRWNAGLGRSVTSAVGLVPLQTVAPTTTGVLWKNEEGNVVSVREAHAPNAETPNKRLYVRKRNRGHVLHSVQRPVHVNRHYTPAAQAEGGVAVGWVSRSGKLTQVRGTGMRGLIERTNARLAARHRSANQPAEVVRDASEKEGGHGHRPCEEMRAPSSVSVRRNAVAEVGRQHPGLE